MNNKEALFFKDKPIFGFDIGYNSIKVLQAGQVNKKYVISGYGAAGFSPDAVKDGVITDLEAVAATAHELFSKHLIGDITTSRVVMSLPAARCYNRTVRLPKLANSELQNAVDQEVEQYIPVPNADLYVDYSRIRETENELELLVVAVPKQIVASYLDLARILNLEVVGIQTSIAAGGRLFLETENATAPTVLIDFGTLSSDITIYDKGLVLTSTIPAGGDHFTDKIVATLGVTKQEAHIIKTKYGLGVSKKQREITEGVTPILQQMIKEIKRMIRYYEERTDTDHKIGQVVTMGGGANMPGLSDYLTNTLRIPTRMCEPWQKLGFGDLQPPNNVEKSMYVTAAGLALTSPTELFS